MRTFRIACISVLSAAFLALSGCSEVQNRDDFITNVKNKSEEDLVKYAGQPSSIDRSDPKHVAYVYKGRTFDVATRHTDSETDVFLAPGDDGKLHVAEVLFK